MAIGKIKHVYFGPKDPETGEPAEEPVYVHQEYPRTLYHPDWPGFPREGKVFDDEAAVTAALADGWVRNPADADAITEPSQDQLRAIEEAKFAAKIGKPVDGEAAPRKVGRPPKA